MCRQCLLEVRPERARFVSDSGAYTLNYAGCHGCKGVKQPIKANNRVVDEDDEEDGGFEEITNFEHTCSVCAHVIAEHYHSFRVVRTPVDPEALAAAAAAAAASPSAVSDAASVVAAAAEVSSPAASAEAAATVAATVSVSVSSYRVTHDYLMECVLCGKGADEQVVQSGLPEAGPVMGSAADAAAAAAAVASMPAFSLSSIQLNAMLTSSRAPGQALPVPAGGVVDPVADNKEADEWAE